MHGSTLRGRHALCGFQSTGILNEYMQTLRAESIGQRQRRTSPPVLMTTPEPFQGGMPRLGAGCLIRSSSPAVVTHG